MTKSDVEAWLGSDRFFPAAANTVSGKEKAMQDLDPMLKGLEDIGCLRRQSRA
jgi:hypothetical protein